MNYERFVATLNHHIFQLEREKLLRKLVNEPERFLGLFRPSKPKGKLFQHLLQAREIGFGDALEEIVAGWLEHYGYQRLDNRIRVNGETMECDHYALSPNQDFGLLIEQKVRDDHDSSKARGQWRNNFAPKVRALCYKHDGKLIAVTYFVDPVFRKNYNLYEREAQQLRQELGLPSIYVWYGKELFEKLPFANPDDWDKMLAWLEQWQMDLPDLPDVNWENPEAIADLQRIARHSPSLWRRFAEQESLWREGYVDVLFPSRSGLHAILKILEQNKGQSFRKAAEALKRQLERWHS
ncbi:MAG: hypothetical protein LKKZDAJK_002394 [Candidatus Fervidibacter sp.]